MLYLVPRATAANIEVSQILISGPVTGKAVGILPIAWDQLSGKFGVSRQAKPMM